MELNTIKVVTLGASGTGKSALVRRYIEGTFDTTLSTLGLAFVAKKVELDNQHFCLGIWDPCGQERYRSLVRIYYQGASAAIVCYDLTLPASLEDAKYWMDELTVHTREDCRIYLVGTKLDLIDDGEFERAIPKRVMNDLANDFGAVLIETSSKTDVNVDKLFLRIVQDYVASGKKTKQRNRSSIFLDAEQPDEDNNDYHEKNNQKRCACAGKRHEEIEDK